MKSIALAFPATTIINAAAFQQVCTMSSTKRTPSTMSPYFAKRQKPAADADTTPCCWTECKASSDLPQHLVGNKYFDNDNDDKIILSCSAPSDFSLSQAICSYGYFCLAPNRWVPSSSTTDADDEGYLVRPLRFGDDHEHSVLAAIGQSSCSNNKDGVASVVVAFQQQDSGEEQLITKNIRFRNDLTQQISRMLRLDLDLAGFHRLNPEAKCRRFGRLYRSPTLFEDIVKTITNCNMQWSGTVDMNRKLCRRVGTNGAFPSPKEIQRVDPAFLKEHCRLGYRSKWIWSLADSIVNGELDLQELEEAVLEDDAAGEKEESFSSSRDAIQKRLKQITGIGDFASNNILQLMGYFDSFPYDTETVRLWREEFGASKSDSKKQVFERAKTHYAQYAPYQFIAYWFNLWENYERRAKCKSPKWSIEQLESERPDGVESDHNQVFVNNSSNKTKKKKTVKQGKKSNDSVQASLDENGE